MNHFKKLSLITCNTIFVNNIIGFNIAIDIVGDIKTVTSKDVFHKSLNDNKNNKRDLFKCIIDHYKLIKANYDSNISIEKGKLGPMEVLAKVTLKLKRKKS